MLVGRLGELRVHLTTLESGCYDILIEQDGVSVPAWSKTDIPQQAMRELIEIVWAFYGVEKVSVIPTCKIDKSDTHY